MLVGAGVLEQGAFINTVYKYMQMTLDYEVTVRWLWDNENVEKIGVWKSDYLRKRKVAESLHAFGQFLYEFMVKKLIYIYMNMRKGCSKKKRRKKNFYKYCEWEVE